MAGSRVGRVLKGSRAKTDDIYADQGFGQKLGLARCPALVVVDFTNGFADTAMLGGGNIRDAILATRPVLEACRRRGLPIVFTRVVYAEDGSDSSLWCEKVPRLRELTETASASQVVAELAPLPGEHIVRKTHASAFFGRDNAAWLIRREIDTVIVTGCPTSGCIRATVVDAMSWNSRPIVLADCVGDRAPGPREAKSVRHQPKYADSMPAAALIDALASLPVKAAAR